MPLGIWGQMCRVWRRHFPPHLSEARRMWQRHFPLSLYTSHPLRKLWHKLAYVLYEDFKVISALKLSKRSSWSSQCLSRARSKFFTSVAFIVSTGRLFHILADRILKAYFLRSLLHPSINNFLLCTRSPVVLSLNRGGIAWSYRPLVNLKTWIMSPLWRRYARVGSLSFFQSVWVAVFW